MLTKVNKYEQYLINATKILTIIIIKNENILNKI